jgi:membrane-bound serine protease (ClpP class)
LLGRHGTAHTVLRPTGVADFQGQRVDVLTEGEFVEAGRAIKVLRVDGHRVVVRSIETSKSSDKQQTPTS